MLFLSAGLLPLCFGAAIPVSCGSIYKSFAQCLVTLGDSLGQTEKDPNTQDIDAICRCVSLFSVVTTFQQNSVLICLSHGEKQSFIGNFNISIIIGTGDN